MRAQCGHPPRIGVSLPYGLLTGTDAGWHDFGGRNALFQWLRQAGVSSIEVRTVRTGEPPSAVARAAGLCAGEGFHVTLHAELPKDGQPATFYAPFAEMLSIGTQPDVMLTVHALPDGEATAQALRALALYADARAYPIRLALENNRRKVPYGFGQCCADAAAAAGAAAHARVGVCWDFGHFYYNLLHHAQTPDALPCEAFCARVFHTHIHGLFENRTHFPPGADNVPLERYCALLLRLGYAGIYNLELDFSRIRYSPRTALEQGVQALVSALERLAAPPNRAD